MTNSAPPQEKTCITCLWFGSPGEKVTGFCYDKIVMVGWGGTCDEWRSCRERLRGEED